MSPERNAALRAWLGYGLALATIVFAARYLGLGRGDFVAAMRAIAPTTLLLAAAAFALHILFNAIAFASLNHAFGVATPSSTLRNAWAASLLAKYVPGGIWHVVGRGLLLARLGVPARISAAVGIAEQGLSLGLCGLLGAAFLFASVTPSPWGLGMVGVGAVILVLLPPRAFGWFRFPVQPGHFRRALLGYSVAMIPYACGYFVIVAPEAPARFLGALFAGTIAGVLALPVPGGLGVRESATSVLAVSAQPAQLLARMLAGRALIFGVEVLVSMIGLHNRRRGAVA